MGSFPSTLRELRWRLLLSLVCHFITSCCLAQSQDSSSSMKKQVCEWAFFFNLVANSRSHFLPVIPNFRFTPVKGGSTVLYCQCKVEEDHCFNSLYLSVPLSSRIVGLYICHKGLGFFPPWVLGEGPRVDADPGETPAEAGRRKGNVCSPTSDGAVSPITARHEQEVLLQLILGLLHIVVLIVLCDISYMLIYIHKERLSHRAPPTLKPALGGEL